MKPSKKKGVDKRFKKLVREAIDKYRRILRINDFEGETLYMAYPYHKDDEKSRTRAEIHVDLRYLSFELRIYPSMIEDWKRKGDEVVEEVIAHEMCHILTQPMINIATASYKTDSETDDAWESLTERISRLAMQIAELTK